MLDERVRTMSSKRKKARAIRVFDDLPDAEKERIFRELASKSTEQLLAESRPLNKEERTEWRQIKRKMGRPRIGKGTTNVSISLEKQLLRKTDRFARVHGISRSEVISRGVKAYLGSAA